MFLCTVLLGPDHVHALVLCTFLHGPEHVHALVLGTVPVQVLVLVHVPGALLVHVQVDDTQVGGGRAPSVLLSAVAASQFEKYCREMLATFLRWCLQ